ncbi:MAG: CocE/NonD family hydrolase, partial [Myxococcota bacterium]|nr:CocE/NonD family hydrolase [Myxococcota bacterium]
NQWLVIGPWDYDGEFDEQDFPGVLESSPESALEAAWRLQCLYEVAGQLDALEPVHVYVMGAAGDGEAPGHEWRSFSTWPPQSDELTLFLTPEGGLGSTEAQEGVVSYQNDPENPVPTVGGRNLSIPSGPLDQSEIEAREDVIVFTSDLSSALEFVGQVTARLWLNSPPGPAQVVVRLTDVHPDGRSLLIASGIQVLEGQGGPVEVEVSLGPTAYHLAEDHQLRLSVSGSSAGAFAVEPTLMSIDLAFGPVTRSRLVLPVISGIQPDIPPTNPEDEPDAGGEETDGGSSSTTPQNDTGGNIQWDLGASGGQGADDAGAGLEGDADAEPVAVARGDEGCGGAPTTTLWTLALLALYGLNRRRDNEPA